MVAGFGGMQDGEAGFNGALGSCRAAARSLARCSRTVKLSKREMGRISGSDHYPSSHPVMRQAKPRMVEVQVVYPTGPAGR